MEKYDEKNFVSPEEMESNTVPQLTVVETGMERLPDSDALNELVETALRSDEPEYEPEIRAQDRITRERAEANIKENRGR